MPMNSQDEIVESRTWVGGVEIVSHVNWSHVARVRRALGFAGEEFNRTKLGRPGKRGRVSLLVSTPWRGAPSRAA